MEQSRFSPDNVKLVELLEEECSILINKAKRAGLNYFQILRVFLGYCPKLLMQSEAEYWSKLK